MMEKKLRLILLLILLSLKNPIMQASFLQYGVNINKPCYNVSLGGYNPLRKDRTDGKGSVAVYVMKGIDFSVINFNHVNKLMCISFNNLIFHGQGVY